MQDGAKDCGVCSLLSIVQYYGGNIPKEKLRVMTNTTRDGVNAYSLLEAAEKIGFDAKGVSGSVFDIDEKFLPCIAHVIIENNYKHFVVIYKIDKRRKNIVIADPAKGIIKMNEKQFSTISTGNFFFFTPSKKIPILKNNNVIKDILINFIFQNKTVFIYIIILSLIFTFLNIITSFNFQFILENALIFESKFNLYFIFGIMCLLSLFKVFSEYFRNNLLSFVCNKMDYKLIVNSFSHILSLPYLYYKNRTIGDVLSRINDLKELKEYVSHIFVTVFVDFILVFLCTIFLFSIDFNLMIIILIFSFLYFMTIFIFNKLIVKIINLCKNNEMKSNSYMVELINGNDTVKSMNVMNCVINKFSYLYDNNIKSNYSLSKCINSRNFFNNLFSYLLSLFVVFIGSIRVIDGNLSLGSLITFNSLIYYFWEPMKNILNLDFLLKNMKIIIDRINDVLLFEKENLYEDNKIIDNVGGKIDINNFSYCYGKNSVINNLSLSIKDKEKVVICGKSGSGKSTLARVIAGFISVERGNVFLNGKDINDFNLWCLRNNITYSSQNEFLFTDSICSNIDINNTRDYDRIIDVGNMCLVNEITENKTNGYSCLLEENGCNLSGGERQRIILARTFLKNSSIYILDESFSQVDVCRERIILQNILKKYSDKTIIVISHRNDNNDLFDRVIDLEMKNEY